MRPLKRFSVFLENKIVVKSYPNKARADDLLKEAKRKSNSLKVFMAKIGLNDENANDVIENCYDIIINLIRSRMLLNGFSSSGYGAHEAEISYLWELKFPEEDIYFADQLRFFRNSILYYGKCFDKEYAKKVLKFLDKVHSKLIK